MSSANIPLQIQRQLRKEAAYGCVLCGCPILEYVHIIPFANIQGILPENMVALCPLHHNMYDNEKELSGLTLRECKIKPHNKIHERDAFTIRSQELTVNIGKCKFVNTTRMLVVDDFDVIAIKRIEEDPSYIILDINFFDKLNSLIAIVSENSWSCERRSNIDWDVHYKPKHLTIQNPMQNMIFDAKINDNNDEITITANGIYYNRAPIIITENEIFLNNEEIALEIKGTVLKNYEVAIAAHTL